MEPYGAAQYFCSHPAMLLCTQRPRTPLWKGRTLGDSSPRAFLTLPHQEGCILLETNNLVLKPPPISDYLCYFRSSLRRLDLSCGSGTFHVEPDSGTTSY